MNTLTFDVIKKIYIESGKKICSLKEVKSESAKLELAQIFNERAKWEWQNRDALNQILNEKNPNNVNFNEQGIQRDLEHSFESCGIPLRYAENFKEPLKKRTMSSLLRLERREQKQ